jgi:hypothetical protein
LSPLPKALQDRLAQHAAVTAGTGLDPSPTGEDPAVMLALAKTDIEAPDPIQDIAFTTADGEVDFSVFAVPSAEPPATRPTATVVAETPAPFTNEQLSAVQKADPELALQVYDTQKQVAGLTAEITRLRERSDQSAQLSAKVAELEAANQALRAQQAAASALSDGLDVADLTDEERALFQDPRLLATMQRVADTRASVMARRLAEQTQTRLDQMEARIQQAAQQAEQQAKTARESALRASLTQVHPDVQAVFKDPAFADYLKGTVPFSRDTLNARLQQAWTGGDMAVVSDIITDYKQRRAAVVPAPAVPQHVASRPSGAPTHAASQAPSPAEKPMLSASLYTRASQQYRNGKMDIVTFDKIRAAYDVAVRENRVVYDNGSAPRG